MSGRDNQAHKVSVVLTRPESRRSTAPAFVKVAAEIGVKQVRQSARGWCFVAESATARLGGSGWFERLRSKKRRTLTDSAEGIWLRSLVGVPFSARATATEPCG